MAESRNLGLFMKRNIKFDAFIISFILISWVSGCGGPVRKAAQADSSGAGLDGKEIIAKHRAFDHFSKADLFEKSGDLEKAADEYRLALFYDPQSDELMRSLAGVLYDLQRYDEALDILPNIEYKTLDDIDMVADCYRLKGDEKNAVKYFKTASDMDTVSELADNYLAVYYAHKGDIKQAEKYLKKLIAESEDSRHWTLELASLYAENGNEKKAEDIYYKILAADSLDNRGWLGLAALRQQQNDTAAADSLYKVVVKNSWGDARLLSMISERFLELRDLQTAIDVTRRIVELYPQDYLFQRRYGLLLFTANEFAQADSVLKAISAFVDDDAVAYYYRARIAQHDADYPQAESLYIKSIAYDDTLVGSWVDLAFVRDTLYGETSSLATFDSAYTACPSDSLEALFYTAVFFGRQQKFSDAINYYWRILAVQSDDYEVQFNLAAAYERTGQYAKAEEFFKMLLDKEPDNAVVLNYLGYMYADQGIKLKQAKKLIEKALEIAPKNGAYLDSYAWVMYKLGRFDEALEYQIRALEATGDDAILLEHMGDIYYALNKITEAQYHWEKALHLNPDNESIKEKLLK